MSHLLTAAIYTLGGAGLIGLWHGLAVSRCEREHRQKERLQQLHRDSELARLEAYREIQDRMHEQAMEQWEKAEEYRDDTFGEGWKH